MQKFDPDAYNPPPLPALPHNDHLGLRLIPLVGCSDPLSQGVRAAWANRLTPARSRFSWCSTALLLRWPLLIRLPLRGHAAGCAFGSQPVAAQHLCERHVPPSAWASSLRAPAPYHRLIFIACHLGPDPAQRDPAVCTKLCSQSPIKKRCYSPPTGLCSRPVVVRSCSARAGNAGDRRRSPISMLRPGPSLPPTQLLRAAFPVGLRAAIRLACGFCGCASLGRGDAGVSLSSAFFWPVARLGVQRPDLRLLSSVLQPCYCLLIPTAGIYSLIRQLTPSGKAGSRVLAQDPPTVRSPPRHPRCTNALPVYLRCITTSGSATIHRGLRLLERSSWPRSGHECVAG